MALKRTELLKLRSPLETYVQTQKGLFYGERIGPEGEEGFFANITSRDGVLSQEQHAEISRIFQEVIGRDFKLNEDVLVAKPMVGVAYSDSGKARGVA